jgi:hypothetical protein
MSPFMVCARTGRTGRSAMPDRRKAKAAPTIEPACRTVTRAVSPSTFATMVEASRRRITNDHGPLWAGWRQPVSVRYGRRACLRQVRQPDEAPAASGPGEIHINRLQPFRRRRLNGGHLQLHEGSVRVRQRRRRHEARVAARRNGAERTCLPGGVVELQPLRSIPARR